MSAAPLPPNELERLKALSDLAILDSAPEQSFEIITRLATELFSVPIALVSLVDKERQWFKSRVGVDVCETSRDAAFCAHAILGEVPLIIEDARLDDRFADNLLVQCTPHIRFYAGVPLKGGTEHNIGTLCIISPEPKCLTDREVRLLKDLARLVDDEIALRQALRVHWRDQRRLLNKGKLAAIGRLAAGIAHEINTPMQFVYNNTEFIAAGFNALRQMLGFLNTLPVQVTSAAGTPLQQCPEVSTMAQDLDLDFILREIPLAISQTQDGIRRVTELVKAMRDFSHDNQSEKRPEQLNQAIESTSVLTRNSWKYVAELKLDLAPSLPSVTCNLGEINQVILNLIVNAADAIKERQALGWDGTGLIQIRSHANDTEVLLEFEDNGIGIPPKILPMIFDPFFTTKEVGKGTGQGLAISYDIVVHKHGGRLEVESKPGARHTVFTLSLPIQPT